MSLLQTVRTHMEKISRIENADDGVRVTTHCLYPSNAFVQVTVRGGVESCVVSDDGRALAEIESEGVDVRRPDALLLHLVSPHGLRMKAGVISSEPVPLDRVALAVSLVANTSKDVANWLYDHSKIRRDGNFKQVVRKFLNEMFEDRVHHDEKIVGESNKTHKFENVIVLREDRRLIIDAVSNDPSSINARVVANLDVRTAKHAHLVQRIVYDDTQPWAPADLNLLQVGARVVPFSGSRDVIEKLANVA